MINRNHGHPEKSGVAGTTKNLISWQFAKLQMFLPRQAGGSRMTSVRVIPQPQGS
jgi:hypothetical protein